VTEDRESQMEPVNPAARRGPGIAGSAIRAEVRATLALATPLAVANLAQMAMAVTNTIMLGRLGAVPLAAAGLGGMLYFTVGVMLQGIPFAVAPLAAHALGAGDRASAGRIAGAGLVLAALLAVPFVAALTNLQPILRALGYNALLANEIGRYLRALAWGAPAFLGFAVLRSLLAALSHTRSVMAVLVACVAGNAALNWLLIWGHLGMPALGMAGSGYASAINQWLMLAGLALCIRLMPRFAALRIWRNMFAAHWTQMASILRLGLPIGVLRGIETSLFAVTGILMGLLGTAALGAHQLVINVASISFMVPLGLSQAATVRVAHALGAGRADAARRAGFAAIALGSGFMAACALLLLAFPQAIIAAYLDISDPVNRKTVEIARQLIAIAALFQVFDGIQVIAAGALRGYKDTTIPLLLATCGYWCVGFAGGWLFAFRLGFGPVGLWWGLALGLAVVAFLLTWRLHLLTPPIRRTVQAVVAE
jgi:multidrug resistance protein, MATE family